MAVRVKVVKCKLSQTSLIFTGHLDWWIGMFCWPREGFTGLVSTQHYSLYLYCLSLLFLRKFFYISSIHGIINNQNATFYFFIWASNSKLSDPSERLSWAVLIVFQILFKWPFQWFGLASRALSYWDILVVSILWPVCILTVLLFPFLCISIVWLHCIGKVMYFINYSGMGQSTDK